MSRLRPILLLPLLLAPAVQAQSDLVPSSVVITEILYAPSPASNEFVELYNRSDEAVRLGALEYADEGRDFAPVAPTDTLLPPGEHVVLARDSAAFAAAFPSAAALTPAGWDALNNGGDTVVLRARPTGTVLDSVPYDPSWGGDEGRSLERIDPAGPSDAPSNFAPSTAAAGATPGRRNSRYDPDETAPRPTFAEQVGDRTVAVTLSEPVRPATVTPGAFELERAQVTTATLTTDTRVTLTLSAPPRGTILRVTGLRDRVGNTLGTATRPLAHRPAEGEIVVNEILYDPRADDFDGRPDQVEYVEVRSRTDVPLTLHDLVVTDRPDEDGRADTLRPPGRAALRARGYGVIAAAPEEANTAAESALAAAFPDAPLAADTVAFLPVDAARLGLSNDGGLVRLHRADVQPIAEVRYSPDWHAPGLAETDGTALERISPDGPAEAADNWTSSPAPAGGTPGTRNAAALPPAHAPSEATLTIAPSPFSVARNGATRIRYTLESVPNLVRVRIYDARGRKVRTLEEARLAGPTGELVWDGRDDAGDRVRAGIYVVLFEAVQTGDGTIATLKKPVVVARRFE
jgi:hypothetical protein